MLQKNNRVVRGEVVKYDTDNVKLMFYDEAGFGRINKPKEALNKCFVRSE